MNAALNNSVKITEQRCECGKLLLKKTPKGFEFKCNRCKRMHVIPFDEIQSEYQMLCPLEDKERSLTPAARGQESNAQNRERRSAS